MTSFVMTPEFRSHNNLSLSGMHLLHYATNKSIVCVYIYLAAVSVCRCVHTYMYVVSPETITSLLHQTCGGRVPVCTWRSKRLVISFLFHLLYLILANGENRQRPSLLGTKCAHTRPCFNAIISRQKESDLEGHVYTIQKQGSVPGWTAAFFSRAHRETWSGWVAGRRHHSLGIPESEAVVQLVHGKQCLEGLPTLSPYIAWRSSGSTQCAVGWMLVYQTNVGIHHWSCLSGVRCWVTCVWGLEFGYLYV